MTPEEIIIQWAKRFAISGYYVFPMYRSERGLEKPYGWARNTVKDIPDIRKIMPATDDPLVIEEWPQRMRAAYKAEVAAYGILGVGCIIFDLDNKDGKNGSDNFQKLRRQYDIPKPSIVAKTKSGGYHLIYGKSEKFAGVKIKSIASIVIAGTKYEGVDVRGDGGMVVGPTCEGPEADWASGVYQVIHGDPDAELSLCPEDILASLSKSGVSDIEDSYKPIEPKNDDILTILRRGEIPKVLPLGERNIGFFTYLTALKNKGFSAESARRFADQLIAVTESVETLSESVNIEDMIKRVWSVNINNPYDTARDLLNCGLFRITGHTTKIKYVMLRPNPYLDSRSMHDLASLKQLLSRFARNVQDPSGKVKKINPADLIDALIDGANEVSNIGFKPGDSQIFTMSAMSGGRRFLNTWQDPRDAIPGRTIDSRYYREFCDLVTRIFGPEGSQEYDLGLDFPAWTIQKPGIKSVIAPYLTSLKRGVGKSLYFSILQNIMGFSLEGDLQCAPYKMEAIVERFFNPSGASILMFDEVQFPVHRDMRKEATRFWKALKNLTTVENVQVEIKGGGIFQVPNLANVIMAGNSGNNFPMEEFDRRIWVIDNSPRELEYGTFDHFFALQKGILDPETKRTICASILKELNDRKIVLQLDRMRAPMNEAKRELYLNSLSNVEEWWITHFEDTENMLAETPVISKSAVIYLLETTERFNNASLKDNPEDTFRDLRRKGLIRSIRNKNLSLTRQLLGVHQVRADGSIREGGQREVLFTSRQHGEYDMSSNEEVLQAYQRNLQTIRRTKELKKAALGQALME